MELDDFKNTWNDLSNKVKVISNLDERFKNKIKVII